MSEPSTLGAPKTDEARIDGLSPDEFLAMVSHELRNANSPILAWAEIISRKPGDAETLVQGIGVIKRSARLQAALINQLLDFSLIKNGGLSLDAQIVELAATVESAIETMRPLAAARSVDLHARLDGSMARVLGDPRRLEQVFSNLLSNAIKFTQPGGLVQVRLDCRREYAQIAISDTGRGISAEFLPYVFERFRREPAGRESTDTTEAGGLGLGLAIARHLVEEHGGKIYADSQGEGKGATFTVYLPLECGAMPPT